MQKTILYLSLIACFSCGQPATDQSTGNNNNDSSSAVQNPADKIPLLRDSVNPEPVQEYAERTDNPLNDWYFSVKLFETEKTFYYLIKLQFEEIRGTDTLKLPNFGTLPQPVIKKGPDKYSCIIGFLDKDNRFRDYKKVYVLNNALKITALKHYGVSTK